MFPPNPKVLCAHETAELNNQNGSIFNLMDNLATHTASVTNEFLTQLLAKAEGTIKTLEDNMEMAMNSVLKQLSQPFENFQQDILSSQCQPLMTLEQLRQQVQSDLSKCTQNLHTILNNFQRDANEFKAALDKSVREIINLPKKCESVESGTGFASNVSSYIDRIDDLNKQTALILNNASETLVLARQLGEQAVIEGHSCANNVMASTMESLDKIQATCQLKE